MDIKTIVELARNTGSFTSASRTEDKVGEACAGEREANGDAGSISLVSKVRGPFT